MSKYEIELIPNYTNDKIIIEKANEMGIKNSGKTRGAGFIGCDTPVILDIECSLAKAQELRKQLESCATDTFGIYERCKYCRNIIKHI